MFSEKFFINNFSLHIDIQEREHKPACYQTLFHRMIILFRTLDISTIIYDTYMLFYAQFNQY